MGVFDGSVKTPRRIADPITDKLVVEVADLTLAAISTPAALLYPGTDVSVVHGDQQLHVDRNRFMKVDMNHNATIGMNEIYLVDMNQTITVMQDYTRDVMMNSLINTTGNYTKNILSNYSKSITGNSTNTILGFYMKSVTMDYTKTIIGTSLNTITGTYTKIVQSSYMKEILGTSTNSVIGDYTKLLSANYVKVVTGNSNVQVISESTVQYQGNHSRTCGSDHRMMIAGSNTHTTCGPTVRTEIDVQVSQQIDDQMHSHPTNLTQENNKWFTTTVKKGQWQQALKVDYTSGPVFSGSIFKLDINALNYGCNGSHNTFFVEKFDCGFSKDDLVPKQTKFNGVSVRVGGIIGKAAVNTSKAAVASAHAGGAAMRFLGGVFSAVPGMVQAGVKWAINQFM